jgi:hypothetical protein
MPSPYPKFRKLYQIYVSPHLTHKNSPASYNLDIPQTHVELKKNYNHLARLYILILNPSTTSPQPVLMTLHILSAAIISLIAK